MNSGCKALTSAQRRDSRIPPGPDRDMFINYFIRFDTSNMRRRETKTQAFKCIENSNIHLHVSESKLLVNIANICSRATKWISYEIQYQHMSMEL